ncbi:hypothetical protein EDD18DRAFT_1114503 [Armillaria luteobubalina]|uniref:Uncharacterized protein n=1 Tax=Armillaria luteobubalina TaxID=153913 RepID=A0AA39P5L4_9AGAR|nr:hypothetical protein EDD18DRAFT_1114503 [Armillaria luteobubalina]
MPPSTDTHPTNTAEIRSDAAPPPTLRDKTHSDSLTSTRDKPLPSLPSIRNANTLEESLRHQRGTLHSSFQRPMLTVETKGNLVRGGKFMRPHHTYAEPRNLSRNWQSFPPPYTAVDPNAPGPSSRAVRWVDRPIDNPHKRRGNVSLGISSPVRASSNTNAVAPTHGQAPRGRAMLVTKPGRPIKGTVHWPHPLDTPFIYEERRTNFHHLDSNLGAISNGNKQIKSRDTHPHSQDDDPSSQRDFGGYQNWDREIRLRIQYSDLLPDWGPSPSSFEISTTRRKRSGDASLRYGTMRGYEVEVQEMMKEIGELRDKR